MCIFKGKECDTVCSLVPMHNGIPWVYCLCLGAHNAAYPYKIVQRKDINSFWNSLFSMETRLKSLPKNSKELWRNLKKAYKISRKSKELSGSLKNSKQP